MFEELETLIQEELTTIASNQSVFFDQIGKYQRLPVVNKEKYSYEVHEYEMTNGEVGYTVIFKRNYYNKVYIRTVSCGPEVNERTNDWSEIKLDIYG